MNDIARCSCGAVSVSVSAEPYAVVACHCSDCRRRTGAPFGVGVYFDRAQVSISGATGCFERPAAEGRKVRNYFCTTCGGPVYWRTDLHPDGVGVALGMFDEPERYTPTRSVFERHRSTWCRLDASIPGHLEGRNSPPSR
ncbi:MAG: GFA family protein [Gammaproteobacteria bacterium]|nr:GFA family protein [Gammaproteobacteria bacterium]